MEGSPHKADKAEFTECWQATWRTPYIMQLALSAGIGGFLFGYNTGVISGALQYIRDEFKAVEKHSWLQEMIVSMTVAGAILGAAFAGWLNDMLGRKKAIIMADILFFFGAVVVATASAPWVIVIGRMLVGLGVGMTSMSAPLYFSEASPSKIRGSLVSANGLLLTMGQFMSYPVNIAFTMIPGTWRWMQGIAGALALVQIILMHFLPESPIWLYQKKRVEETRTVLERIYSADEVEQELRALEESLEHEKSESQDVTMFSKFKNAWGNIVVRRALYAGIATQVTQQFTGINAVIYYSPTIMQLAGFSSHRTAITLSLVTSGVNAVGTIISMCFVDKYGRRRLMIISMLGTIMCLTTLSFLFKEASIHSPAVSIEQSTHFGVNTTCPAFLKASNPATWDCMSCVHAPKCSFCSNSASKYNPGACLSSTDAIKRMCKSDKHEWYSQGCPNKFGLLAVLMLGAYVLSYALGIGPAPWIVNSEIYPLRYRGLGGGIATVSNWVSNFIVRQTFLTLTEALGHWPTFLLFAGFALIGLIAIFFLVPETKGLPSMEIEKLLEKGYSHRIFGKRSKDTAAASSS